VERSRGIWAGREGAEEGLSCVEEHAELAAPSFSPEYVCKGWIMPERFSSSVGEKGTFKDDMLSGV
jgi:hypothetical protein